MDFTIKDIRSRGENPIYEFIETISDEPLSNNYFIENKPETPLTYKVTIIVATKSKRVSVKYTLIVHLTPNEKFKGTKRHNMVLIKCAAMTTLGAFFKTLNSAGQRIDARTFLILPPDEDLEAALNNNISPN